MSISDTRSRISEIMDRWPARQNEADKRTWALRRYPGLIAQYITSPMSLFTEPKRHSKVADGLTRVIEHLQGAVDALDALDRFAIYQLTVAGMPDGQAEVDPGVHVRLLLRQAKEAYRMVRPKRGRPMKIGQRILADLIWQAFVAITGETPRAYKKNYSDQPPTDYESACIDIFGVLGLSSTDALTAAQASGKARRAAR